MGKAGRVRNYLSILFSRVNENSFSANSHELDLFQTKPVRRYNEKNVPLIRLMN